MRLRRTGCTVVGLLGILLLPFVAHAQSVSTADLAGTWSVFHLTTPMGAYDASDVRQLRGQVTFDATGTVTSGSLTDGISTTPFVTGTFSVSPLAVVDGALSLGGVATFDVREARLLLTRHTIVGAASVGDQVGLFTFVKVGQIEFGTNLPGNWHYHEITPGSDPAQTTGEASWTAGSITFHAAGNCTEADLTLADGTIRAQRDGDPTSFG